MENIKMDIEEIWCYGVNWTDLTQDANKLHALENTKQNLRFHKTQGLSCVTEELLDF
jgi:hypothetical protein